VAPEKRGITSKERDRCRTEQWRPGIVGPGEGKSRRKTYFLLGKGKLPLLSKGAKRGYPRLVRRTEVEKKRAERKKTIWGGELNQRGHEQMASLAEKEEGREEA